MTEEELEWCKREKDWTERRKYDEVNDKINTTENNEFCQNKDMENRYDYSLTCWNDYWPLCITDKDLIGCETCCADYSLHKVFLHKDSVNLTLISANMLPTYTLDNRSTSEDHISSKPMLVKQNAQWWSRSQRVTPRRSVLKAHATQALVNTTILSAAHSLTLSPLMGTSSNISSCQHSRISKILESDGDSPRSASPQSSEPDEDDAIFRNEKRSFGKLSDYISEGAASASRDTSGSGSESPGQQDRLSPVRRKEKEDLKIVRKEPKMSRGNDIINTLNDHCYHQPRSMERLVKRPTFSETGKSTCLFFPSYSDSTELYQHL